MVVSALAALALVGLGVGLWYNGQLQTALQDAGQQRQEADKQRKRVEELQFNIRYVRDMNLAQRPGKMPTFPGLSNCSIRGSRLSKASRTGAAGNGITCAACAARTRAPWSPA